ncbi:beta-ketoacyl-ACP synthase II [Cesiribacter andamanensis]|uniref:3-oxoacyl-[acyl-carrier-protein] synthase 2 n=1 Tax=Cesiribacter andamanensis AMV16 TaxID=1279009 RepID=M7N3M8_9BACT|nr:beta-ketoacyl-ACP synthase II [Cesiribacter andamanensis]EMR01902.1 3-oxoacyl-[acyl-carrier-protein] synthase 2 [Cesiribacter andamanensis AMV16]
MYLQRVVITGMGALTPIGLCVPDFWTGLLEGQSGGGPITRFDTRGYRSRMACELKDFRPGDYLDHKTLRQTDRFSQYALIAADEALRDAGIFPSSLNPLRCGVIWASGNGGVESFEQEIRANAASQQPPRYSPYMIPKMLLDTPSGLLAVRHGFRGPNFGTVSACAAATSAIIEAFTYLRLGKAELMLCGGSEAPITPAWVGGFDAMKALSRRNQDPMTASRPFAPDRDGFVIGEGAGALVLEGLESALARGARIYAEVVGGGMSADAWHPTAPEPQGKGALLSMQWALEEAGIQPREVGYVNAHATSTPAGDLAEAHALAQLFGQGAGQPYISSTKGHTGHLLGAAGAIEAIATACALHQQIIPHTASTPTTDPALPQAGQFLLHRPTKRSFGYALSNSFGFGGHNASLLLKRWKK